MDINILLKLQEWRTHFCDQVFLNITFLAEDKFFYYVLAAIYWCINKEMGISLGFYLNLSGILNTFFKSVLRVPRPFLRDQRLEPVASAKAGATGFACPSGHTSQAASIYGGIAFANRKKRAISTVMILLTVFMAFSRLYLGVHTLQDVFLAAAIAVLVMVVMQKIWGWIENGNNRDILFAVGVFAGTVILAVISFGIPYEAAMEDVMYRTYMDIVKKIMMVTVFLLSWLWERRKLHYQVPKELWKKLLIFCFGSFILFLIYNQGREYINQICIWCFQKKTGKIIGRGIGSALMTAWVYGIYPCIIMKVQKGIANKDNVKN